MRSLVSQMIRSWSMLARTPLLSGRWPCHAPAVGEITAPSVHPLSRAVLVEQANRNGQRRDAPIPAWCSAASISSVAMPRRRHGSPTAIWRTSGMPRLRNPA